MPTSSTEGSNTEPQGRRGSPYAAPQGAPASTERIQFDKLLVAAREVVRADQEEGYPVGDEPYAVWRAISELRAAVEAIAQEHDDA